MRSLLICCSETANQRLAQVSRQLKYILFLIISQAKIVVKFLRQRKDSGNTNGTLIEVETHV